MNDKKFKEKVSFYSSELELPQNNKELGDLLERLSCYHLVNNTGKDKKIITSKYISSQDISKELMVELCNWIGSIINISDHNIEICGRFLCPRNWLSSDEEEEREIVGTTGIEIRLSTYDTFYSFSKVFIGLNRYLDDVDHFNVKVVGRDIQVNSIHSSLGIEIDKGPSNEGEAFARNYALDHRAFSNCHSYPIIEFISISFESLKSLLEKLGKYG